jgi:hypothetical protein
MECPDGIFFGQLFLWAKLRQCPCIVLSFNYFCGQIAEVSPRKVFTIRHESVEIIEILMILGMISSG